MVREWSQKKRKKRRKKGEKREKYVINKNPDTPEGDERKETRKDHFQFVERMKTIKNNIIKKWISSKEE